MRTVSASDSYANCAGQLLPYGPSPVTGVEITLTRDGRPFMSGVIALSCFLRWQL